MRGIRGLIALFACAVVIVGVPAVAQARTLYVPNSGSQTVSTIDTATNTAGAALTFPSAGRPWLRRSHRTG
jgi:YVTN family beta-propeller protein